MRKNKSNEGKSTRFFVRSGDQLLNLNRGFRVVATSMILHSICVNETDNWNEAKNLDENLANEPHSTACCYFFFSKNMMKKFFVKIQIAAFIPITVGVDTPLLRKHHV